MKKQEMLTGNQLGGAAFPLDVGSKHEEFILLIFLFLFNQHYFKFWA
jgi:hypothetical protein